LASHSQVTARTVAHDDGDTGGRSLGNLIVPAGGLIHEEWLVGPDRVGVPFLKGLTVDPGGCEALGTGT
jgi:hypothetical protein